MKLTALLAGILFALITLYLAVKILPEVSLLTVQPEPDSVLIPDSMGSVEAELAQANAASQATTVAAAIPHDSGGKPAMRSERFDIFGQVTDAQSRPIANVLVSDELDYGGVRTDIDGRYAITLRSRKLKTPFLNFLRDGYREQRIGIVSTNSEGQSRFEIDVKLETANNTANLEGWIGNDLGEQLGGQKIRIRASTGQGAGHVFYSVISDDNGNFSFEGIRSDISYRMEINPGQDYAGFTLESLQVSKNTQPLEIVLERLEKLNVEGMIVDVNQSPVENFEMTVQNLSLDYPDQKITSDASGFFEIREFPAGEVKLSTNAPLYFKITGLTLQPTDYRYLVLSIDRGNHFLSGVVLDDEGLALEGARVVLQSTLKTSEYQSYAYRSQVTDPYGSFSFNDLGGLELSIGVYAKGFTTHIQRFQFSDFSANLEIRLSR